jgi:hypothetical protein
MLRHVMPSPGVESGAGLAPSGLSSMSAPSHSEAIVAVVLRHGEPQEPRDHGSEEMVGSETSGRSCTPFSMRPFAFPWTRVWYRLKAGPTPARGRVAQIRR